MTKIPKLALVGMQKNNTKSTIAWVILAIFGPIGLVVCFVLFSLIAVMIIVIFGTMDAATEGCASSGTTRESRVVQAKAAKNSIPRNYLDLYVAAENKWNIPWYILAGIGYVETHHGTLDAPGVHSGENYAGAAGPMQFLQSTFDMVNDDDDKKSRYSPRDAIFSAAKLLKMHIVGTEATDTELKNKTLKQSEIRQTLYSYNHSWKYVNDVLAKAKQYAADYDVTSPNYAETGPCSGPLIGGSGSFGQQIAYEAAYYAKKEPGTPQPPRQKERPTPYSWGGGTLEGPSRGIKHGTNIIGFDCSGLARYAVYHASGKQIVLPRNTHRIWEYKKGVKKVPRNKLAPGDLVFFNKVEHMGIYYGQADGVRWMVEAQRTGTDIKFSKFDKRAEQGGYVGALRVVPPPGMESRSPVPARAIAPAWADARVGVM